MEKRKRVKLKGAKVVGMGILCMLGILFVMSTVKVQAATKISKVSGISANATSATSIKVTWGKASDAKGYVVYRSTSKNGKYKKIKTITSYKTVKYTDKKLTTGVTYYYKVRAYTKTGNVTKYGSYSKIVKSKAAPVAPKVRSAITIDQKKIKIKWSAVSRASGYAIYRKEGTGSFKKIATVSGESTKSYTDTSASKGKEYTYSVAAYKSVKSKKIIGTYNKTGVKAASVMTISDTSKPYQRQYVKNENYNSSTQNYYTLRSYMEYFEKLGSGVIILKSGTYNIPVSIYIPNNVKIILANGVVINKTDSVGKAKTLSASNKLFVFVKASKKDKKSAIGSYDGVHDVTITSSGAATINMKTKDGVVFGMAHNDDMSFSNIKVNLKATNGKAFTLSGCSDVKIDKCSVASSKSDGRAVLIDLPAKGIKQSYQWSKEDNTVCKNITISNTKFSKLKYGIYSYEFIKDKYQSKIAITSCSFKNMTSDAIRMVNWTNPSVTKCTFNTIGKGAVVNSSSLVCGIRMYGVNSPTVTNNMFDKVERTILMGVRQNDDSKLKSAQGKTVNNISESVINTMLTNNTIKVLGDYFISKVDSMSSSAVAKKYYFPDSTTMYTIATTSENGALPYRNSYIGNSNYNTNKDYYLIRSYLDQIERSGGGTLTIKAGTYDVTASLYVPSNTTIYFESGVTIRAQGKTPFSVFQMANRSEVDAGTKYSGYSGAHDISLIGPTTGTATIDKNKIAGTSLGIGHTTNITVKNLCFKNVDSRVSHYIELDASDNTVIENNIFIGNTGKSNATIAPKEAINIDNPDKANNGFDSIYTSYDKTPDKNIYIRNNTFSSVLVAIGTHNFSYDSAGRYMHTNIQITNNRMTNCVYYAVRAMNWNAPVITGNTINGIATTDSTVWGEQQGIFLQGVKNPTITNNTVSNMNYFMLIRPVNPSNKNYEMKSVLSQADVTNFYQNKFGANVTNHTMKYKLSANDSYTVLDLDATPTTEFTITPTTGIYMNVYDIASTDATYQYYVIRSYLEHIEDIGGGTLNISAGDYTVSGTLYIPSNTTINIASGATLTKGTASARMFVTLNPNQKDNELILEDGEGVSNVTIQGEGTINLGNISNVSTAITCARSSNITISGITFDGCQGATYIRVYSASNVTVDGCTFNGTSDTTSLGIRIVALDDYSYATCSDVIIRNSTFTGLKYAIATTTGDTTTGGCYQSNITVENNIFSECSRYYLQVYGWSHVAITGNIFNGIADSGVCAVHLVGIKDELAITGNIFSNMDKAVGIETDEVYFLTNTVTDEEYAIIESDNTFNIVTTKCTY